MPRFHFDLAYRRAYELSQERQKFRPMTADEDRRHETLATIIDQAFGFGLDAKHTMVGVEGNDIFLAYLDTEKHHEIAIYIHQNGSFTKETRDYRTRQITFDITLKKRTA